MSFGLCCTWSKIISNQSVILDEFEHPKNASKVFYFPSNKNKTLIRKFF